jgi:glucosamine-6-phosphate deaminase
MEVIIESSAERAGEKCARIIARRLKEKPDAVLGLATGRTPLGLYRELVRLHRAEALDFSRVTTFNLDEYVGLDAGHPASYHTFMWNNLFSHVNIARERVHIPDGLAEDIPEFCADYERRIRAAGGIDIQVLGIGSDGHLGFNEPSSSLSSRTRIKTLTERTRADNERFFSEGQVPHHVITMGLGTIMDSRVCLLLAFGEGKANAVRDSVEGPVTAMVPGSLLQFHERTKVLLDEAAASKLERRAYYKWVYRNKPAWQQDR